MGRYRGFGQIVEQDVPVTVEAVSESPRWRGQASEEPEPWRGRLRGDRFEEFAARRRDLTLRLPNGQTGTIHITRGSGVPGGWVEFEGTGPPPFR